MKKPSLKTNIILFLFLTYLIISCKSPTDSNEPINVITGKVTFFNDTQFYVKVYRDTSIPLFDELAPRETKTGDIRESVESHIGTTFRYSYRFKLSEPDDTFSGEAFADGNVGDLEETFVIENGKEYTRKIPIPENIVFSDAYIRIKNNASFNVMLRRIGAELLQFGNRELMIPAGRTGIYRIGRYDFNMADYTLRNVEIPYSFPAMTLSAGYVYDFFLTDEELIPQIVSDTRWKIKPEPTSTWKKDITKYYAGNFTDANSELNNYLKSINRYAISHWRSNYPVSKLLYNNGFLVSGEWSFGVIPTVIQLTGVAAPYEIPLIVAKDAEWENSVIPVMNIHAGTLSTAHQTTFNDIIKLSQNYVVLATYSNGWRTGLWLSFLNEQGQVVGAWDIPPDNNLEALIGTKLVKLDGDSFLVLGNKRMFSTPADEIFTTSSSFIYKYQYGNETKVWSTEYNHPVHYANSSICGLELPDSYFVGCYASDNLSTRTIVLKLNKTDGNVMATQSIGTANDSWRPFSVGSDEAGHIYIIGIATEGASSKAYILKLDSSYTQLWLKRYGSNYDNFLFDLNVANNLLTAVGSGNNGSIADPSFYGWQAGSAWVLRVDTVTGIVIKENTDNTVSAFNSIVRLDDGGFVFTAIKSIDNTKPYWFDTIAVKVNEHLIGE
jgi:hypothetical protein